jgi:hypothetical protein
MGDENRIAMLALVLIEENTIANLILKELREADITVFRYRDPLRVVDCVRELEPDAILVRQKDFPLHAQMLAAMVRFSKPLQRCKFILIGEGEPAPPSYALIEERSLSEKRSSVCAVLLGPHYDSAPKGSRLVARAQRIMKE